MIAGYRFRALRDSLEERYLAHCGYGSGREFVARLVASVRPGDVLLDVGCGEGRLREKLSPTVQYVGLDRYVGDQCNEYANWYMRPSVVGDAHQLPVSSTSCRTVALMHVLEHAREPSRVFAEIFRVLKPGGYLFVDVPFLHELHRAPYDYYRYTPYALTVLAEAAELEVVEIRPSGGYFRALSHLLSEAPNVVRGGTAAALIARMTVAYPLKGLGWVFRLLQYLLDLQDASQTFTCGYHCVFRKPLLDSP